MASATKNISFSKKLRGLRMTYVGAKPVAGNIVPQIENQAYQKGIEETTQKYENQLADERKEFALLKDKFMEELGNKYEQLLEQMNSQLPDVVMAVVNKVWGSLELEPHILNNMVEDVLSEISPAGEDLEVYMNPADIELLTSYDDNPETRYPGLKLIEDDALKSGDIAVHSRFGNIDARIDTKLKKIEEDLKGPE